MKTKAVFVLIVLSAILSMPHFVFANYFTVPVTGATITSYFDHDTPDYTDDSYFVRYDGTVWSDGSASLVPCQLGKNCYDGHNGVDFATTTGADVLAAADGAVANVYWNDCGGETMRIWHSAIGLSSLYAHLGTTTVATTSDSVSRGQHIADVASTGTCDSGIDLHFGVTDGNSDGSNRIDPYGWWGAGSDPWSYDKGYLWTTDPPSTNLANEITGISTTTSTWRGNYVLNGTITIGSTQTVNVTPGTAVKFKTNTSYLVNNGTLDAEGTADLPIVFTSYKDDTAGGDTNGDATSTTATVGDWGNIYTSSTGSTTINHAVVKYGARNCCGTGALTIFTNNGGVLNILNSLVGPGNYIGINAQAGTTTVASTTVHDNAFAGLDTASTGFLDIASSTVSNNNSYGISADSGSLRVASSTFTGNSTAVSVTNSSNTGFTHWNNTASGGSANGFVMHSSIGSNTNWTADMMPYILSNSSPTSVNSGKTLTIDPGAIIKFNSTLANLTVNGTLNAQGTSGQPIYFTSVKDDVIGGDTNGDGTSTSPAVGNWGEVKFTAGTTGTLSYGVFRYGGNTGNGANIDNAGGAVSISNSQVASSSSVGIYTASGTTTVSGSEIFKNVYGFAFGGGTTTASSSSIHGNSSYGAWSGIGTTQNFESNYWGAASGPTHASNPAGTGDKVSNGIDFSSWLTSWP